MGQFADDEMVEDYYLLSRLPVYADALNALYLGRPSWETFYALQRRYPDLPGGFIHKAMLLAVAVMEATGGLPPRCYPGRAGHG